MGRMQAQEMAGMGLDIDVALSWHLQSNHYPPVPTKMNAIAKRAIELAVKDEWGVEIELPEGVTFRNGSTMVRPHQVIESFHLEDFVEAARADEEEL